MRCAIYGAGAMGTVLGAFIARAGKPIDLINRNERHITAMKEKGAAVCGTVQFTQQVHALLPSEMDGKYDVILLMTKQRQNAEIAAFFEAFPRRGRGALHLSERSARTAPRRNFGRGPRARLRDRLGRDLPRRGRLRAHLRPVRAHLFAGRIRKGKSLRR